MTPDEIARDLAHVGCGCSDDEADACPNFVDGWCRRPSNAIADALRAAEARGYAQAREQAGQWLNDKAESLTMFTHGAGQGASIERGIQRELRDAAAAISAMQPEDQPSPASPPSPLAALPDLDSDEDAFS